MIDTFINRPVLSIVISLIIVLLGVLSIIKLPVTQYPDIAPPAVTVTTKYTGANAETCAKAVVTPLERAINGVPGMTYMTSVSGNDGTSIIQIYFQVGVDPDLAAVNVQNRVSTVLDELPEEVIKAGVQTEKEINSMLMYLNLVCTDADVDEKFVYNFADINLIPELKRIDGVGFIEIMGSREYSMRVWLKPNTMAIYDISAEDVVNALRNQNVEAAPGKIGESSGRGAQSLQYVLRYTGKYTEEEQFENIIIQANSDGEVLHLKDIADIEFGSLDYNVISMENGKPSAAIIVKQRPGSNASDVIANIKTKMEELKESTFPSNINYTISYDVSRFLDASIHEVIRTLIEAFILVAIVVFIFLQDFRSTLIPALAVPVSLIGTFFFMQIFGFSINLLTLFALVLAIGIVIDDAIVVVEAVHAKMAKLHCDARTATQMAMKEISGAIISITLVMSAVFIPVAFMDGPTGVFYRQFSITLAISIVISGINALTLTPALCAIMLQSHDTSVEKKRTWLTRFFAKFNRKFARMTNKYAYFLRFVINRRAITFVTLAIFIIASWGVNSVLPAAFIPTEDQGTIYANITTPAGATVERTQSVVEQIEKVTEELEAVESVSTLAGFSLMTDGAGASFGMVMVNLKPWHLRRETVDDVITLLNEKTSHIKDASIQFFPPPAVPGYGNSGGFELRIQDKTRGNDLHKIQEIADDFVKKINERPEVRNAFTGFDVNFPQYLIKIDNEKAAQKGVTIANAMNNLQTLIGSYYASNFIRYGQMYKVMVQTFPRFRSQPEDILQLHVKNNEGKMVPYAVFTIIERVYGPEQLTRYNMFTSAMVNGDAAPGYSSGDAIDAIKEVAETLPRGYDMEWSGMTRDEILSGNQVVYTFVICLVFVYLLLSAQYDSFLLPLPVLLSLPAGVFGSYCLLLVTGLQNNIYAQVAMVMLIGLLGKNAILIVEFAIQKQKDGMSRVQAAVVGATDRLRPILMTSFAFVAGLIPLVLAQGAGAIGNKTIGTAAAGGMLIGTLFGLVLIPGLYVIFAKQTPGAEKEIQNKKALRKMISKLGAPTCILLLIFVSITSCKVPSVTPTSTNIDQLPAHYLDSTNFVHTDSLDLNWQQFFSDSILISFIDESLKSNFDILKNYQMMTMAEAGVIRQKGKLLPRVNAVSSAGMRRFGDYTMDGVGNYDTKFSPNITKDQIIPEHLPDYFMGFQSTWEIDIWKRLRNKKQKAIANYLASVEGKNWLITNVVAEIAMAYYELLALDHEREIIDEAIVLQKEALDIVILQKKVGKANELAVQQFKAQYLNSMGLDVELKKRIALTENKLNFLLGRYPQPIERKKETFAKELPAVIKSGIPSDLLQNRPDVLSAEHRLMAAKADVAAARSAFYPTLTINTHIGLQSFNASKFIDPKSLTYNLLGGLMLPAINRSAIIAEFNTADAQQIEAMYDYQKSVLNAYTEVYNQLIKIENYAEQYSLKNEEVEVLRKSIQTSSELFYTGRATYYEIILSQKNTLNSRLELIEVKKNQLYTMVQLYKALGGGWQ